ncbi:guanylate kinase-like [Paramacrobiotus metropolitanus]|uniref:guanylate kinase-like n=1 Tax=Paramacrobiotus metropolitanus TaxID=2943436 RepID=UPI0024464943|nr:guanylate kinase-like [Paramacrobiotus metropolitanus]
MSSPGPHYYDMDLTHAPAPSVARLVVIAGPACSGKSGLIKRLLTDLGKDKIGFSVSHTTRPPRPEEQEGIHYHFFTDEAFEMAVQNNEFVEHTEFCGHRYGTSKRAVLSVLETGKLCLLQLNMQGLKNLKKLDLNPVCIWIDTPNLEELEERITERGAESEAELEERLAAAKEEKAYGRTPGLFDFLIVNDNFDVAYDELKQLIERLYTQTAHQQQQQQHDQANSHASP